MRNIFKKSLLFIATCLMASTLGAQQTTFGFESANELSSNFTYSCEYSNATMTIATDKKHGGSSSLKAYMGGSGGKSNFLVTKNSYNNVTQIKFWIASSDKGKTEFAIESCASENFSSGVNSILALTTFSNLPGISSPSNNTFYEVTITPATAINGYLRFTFRQPSSSGKYLWFDDLEITASTAPIISTDATLSALTYNGISVPNFSANTLRYEVELPAGTTTIPTVAATKNDTKASDPVITQATALPGNATVTVTAEDGTTTKTYTITFTVASSAPKVTSATWTNIKGTATIDQVNKTITGQVTNGSSLTAITPTFTGDNVTSWTPNTTQDFSNGAVNYTFKSSTNETTVYAVTITEAPAMSSDATLRSLTYGGKSVPNFSPTTYRYEIELTAGIKTPPTIAATANDIKSTVSITQASSVPGRGTVLVTAEDGTQQTYIIDYTVPVPESGLALHEPGAYEGKKIDGGYVTPLVDYNGYEYEIYYTGKTKVDGSSVGGIGTQLGDDGKVSNIIGIAGQKQEGDWFEGQCNSPDESTSASSIKQFPGYGGSWKIYGNEIKIHISGYDQFSVLAKDKKSKLSDGRYIQIKVDGADVTKESELSTSVTARDYTISTGEHVIEIIGTGSEASQIYGFSLRIPKEPRTKRLKGNDSTQVVYQTAAMRPVTYITKYNNVPGAETRLEWDGDAATGIGLQKKEGAKADTFLLSGLANCPVGVYNYAVVAYLNNVETSRETGKFTVASDISASTDVDVIVYQNEEMDQIQFSYFALSANDVTLRWTNGTPGGTVEGSGNEGKYIIGGTPVNIGTFPYEISVLGADTVIKGKVTVRELNYGTNPVLYLRRTIDTSYDDVVYKYLEKSGKWTMIARKQKADGLRPYDQYQRYKLIIISEDVDADNPEVIQLIRGGGDLPVLNLNGYTYSTDGLDDETRLGWGEPNSGAIDSTAQKVNGCKIRIEQPNHPVFSKMTGVSKGAEIAILDGYVKNGVMPIHIYKQGTLCLATGYTRSKDYYGTGDLETAIHEVPADMRGGKKYICLPISHTSSLSDQGKKLIDGIIDYLTNTSVSPVQLPSTQIIQFTVAGINADIDHAGHSIVLKMTVEDYVANDSLRAAKPKITLADPANTHVTPDSEEEVDLRFTAVGLTKKYTVSDYINQWTYNFSIKLYMPQGIEEAYESGMWVNIYDIYGRKVATTNEDIYSMDLPHGMYIVVTENGSTLKIMR